MVREERLRHGLMTVANVRFLCEQLKCFILKLCKISLKSDLNLVANQNEVFKTYNSNKDRLFGGKKKNSKNFENVTILFLNFTKVT